MFKSGNERILIIAPHCDDECIGCGGMIKLATEYKNEVKVIIGAAGNIHFYHLDRIVTYEERVDELSNSLNVLGVDDFEVLFKGTGEGELDREWLKER